MNSELHNPDNLTPDQYGAADGWRLLNADENGHGVNPRKRCDEVGVFEAWRNGKWTQGSLNGLAGDATYRTRLTPAELRAARGIPEQPEENGAELLMHHLIATGQATTKHPEQPVSDTPEFRIAGRWDKPDFVEHQVYDDGSVVLLIRTGKKLETIEFQRELAAAQRENAELRGRLREEIVDGDPEIQVFSEQNWFGYIANGGRTEPFKTWREAYRAAESYQNLVKWYRTLARAEAAEAKIRSMQEANGRSEPNA